MLPGFSRETKSRVNEVNMKLPLRRAPHRRAWVLGVTLGLLALLIFWLLLTKNPEDAPVWKVSPARKSQVHEHVHSVLEGECRHGNARKNLLVPTSSHFQPFLWKNAPLSEDLFLYPPPFGFSGVQDKVEELLQLLPDSDVLPQLAADKCQRCVVIGNGGVLKGLELGPLIDRFDIIIRLNSGPLGKFSVDVGNRTSIRMSYPEGTPLHWADTDPHAVFVGVMYKSVDISWMSAMIRKVTVSLWDWLFFWQKVPDHIPIEPPRFRLINPHVIRETALDLLKYSPPRPRLWGWDQNIPTLGVSALNLASLLCDEVSLAGFGYNLSQQGTPLHYYDHLPLSAMSQQKMHNIDKETELLKLLVREGTVTDLTGGIHCSFCHS